MAFDLMLGETKRSWSRGGGLGAAEGQEKIGTGQKVATVAVATILGGALLLGLREASKQEFVPARSTRKE